MAKILFTRRFEGDDIDTWKEAAQRSKARDLTEWIQKVLNRAAKPKSKKQNNDNSHPAGRRYSA